MLVTTIASCQPAIAGGQPQTVAPIASSLQTQQFGTSTFKPRDHSDKVQINKKANSSLQTDKLLGNVLRVAICFEWGLSYI